MFADSKKSRTFASLLKTSTSEKEFWRDGRVVDCGGLENRCTARYRGFESLSLRQSPVKRKFYGTFFMPTLCHPERAKDLDDIHFMLAIIEHFSFSFVFLEY